MCRFITLTVTLLVGLLLAACVNTGSQVSAGSAQYTLAVLPWQVAQEYYSGSRGPLEITLNEFQYVLGQSTFVPVFSYYDLQQNTTIIKDRPGVEEIWRGRGFLSDPDHQSAFAIGAELGVDAVITYAVTELQNQDYMYVYLYDIPSKIIHEVSGTTGNFARDAPAVLVGMTRRVFAKFFKKRAKIGRSGQLGKPG